MNTRTSVEQGGWRLKREQKQAASTARAVKVLSRTFCSFFPVIPIPSSLNRVRRSAPNYSCRETLLWVQQAQLNPCSHSQKTKPQEPAERLILVTKEAAIQTLHHGGLLSPWPSEQRACLCAVPRSRAGSQAHQTAPVKRRARPGRSLCKTRAPKAGQGWLRAH